MYFRRKLLLFSVNTVYHINTHSPKTIVINTPDLKYLKNTKRSLIITNCEIVQKVYHNIECKNGYDCCDGYVIKTISAAY